MKISFFRITINPSYFTLYHTMSRRSSWLAANEKNAKEQDFMRRVISASEDGLCVINAGVKGRGVAAEKEFRIGDYVAQYQGELISHKEALERY